MRTIKPFKEPPFAPHLERASAELAENLTHYELDNGLTVSVLRSVWGWEAWAWATASPKRRLTPEPIVYDSEGEALAYRDAVAREEAA